MLLGRYRSSTHLPQHFVQLGGGEGPGGRRLDVTLCPEPQQHFRGRFIIRGIEYEQPVEGQGFGPVQVSIVRR